MKSVVYHLGGLTESLEQLYRIEMGLTASAPVDVAALLQEVVTVIQERAETTDRFVSCIQHSAMSPPPISGNERLLYMAIYNLLDNALKYTRPGDKIEAEAVKEGAYAIIRVADTGPGIRDADQPFVWNPFFRGKETRSSIPGYGLGLALVRAIVTRHEGEVRMESRVGQGTAITLRMPGVSEK
jgi:two-component system OmpR family sensor kinase